MVITTEADRPTIRRLESDTPISITTDMSALDRAAEASGNAAVMSPHPGTVSRALATTPLPRALALKPVGSWGRGIFGLLP